MPKTRTPLQVSPKFLEALKDLQRKIRMKTGNDRSLRELTDDLASTPAFQELEKKIEGGNINMDIRVKMDMRKLLK